MRHECDTVAALPEHLRDQGVASLPYATRMRQRGAATPHHTALLDRIWFGVGSRVQVGPLLSEWATEAHRPNFLRNSPELRPIDGGWRRAAG